MNISELNHLENVNQSSLVKGGHMKMIDYMMKKPSEPFICYTPPKPYYPKPYYPMPKPKPMPMPIPMPYH
ncbi:hypothetical protein [Dapis sp. BLCC M126]|uniref:hypothetical protein n=1 Tax=Dapis sp. BLCC M126 TaxID=3400189 RepID=UPI003CF2AEC7